MFDAEQYLEEYAGDAAKAITALEDARKVAQEGRDKEGQAARQARQARDIARAELGKYQEYGSPQEVGARLATLVTLEDVLTRAGVTPDQLPEQLEQAAAAHKVEQELLLTRAAAAHGVTDDDLREWLGTRELRRVVTDDGSVVYGVPDADGVRPLGDYKTMMALQQRVSMAAALPLQRAVTVPPRLDMAARGEQIRAAGRGTI